MQLLQARDAVADLLAELPRQVHDMLEHVTCQVLEWPPHGVRSDAKGLFFGVQQQGGPEDPCAVDLAHGAIQLYAGNLTDAAEAQVAVMHEIGHALGESEWDVAALGLSA